MTRSTWRIIFGLVFLALLVWAGYEPGQIGTHPYPF